MSNKTTQWVLELVDKISSPMRAVENTASETRNAVDSISHAGNRLESGFGGIIKKLGLVALATTAVYKAQQYVANSVRAYEEESIAISKLQQVMSNTMGVRGDEIQSVLNLAAAQQKLGVVGDETQLAGAQELSTYLSKKESLEKLMPAMNDMLAQQHGLNATQEQAANIGMMLGKVMQGQTGALSRYGYAFTEAQEQILKTGTEAQRAAVLFDVVNEAVGGVNEALAKTPEGKLKQHANNAGDLQERVGKLVVAIKAALLPVFDKLYAIVENIINVFEENETSIISFVDTIMSVVTPIIESLWAILQKVGNVIKEVLSPVFKTFQSDSSGIADFFKVIMDVIGNLIDLIGSALVPIFKALWDGVMRIVSACKNALQPMLNALADKTSWYSKCLGFLKDAFVWLVEMIIAIVIPVIELIISIIGVAIDWYFKFGQALYDAFIAVRSFLSGVWGAVKVVFGGIGGFITDVLSGVWHLIKGVFNPKNWFDNNFKLSDGLDKITNAAKTYGESIGKAFQEGKAAGMADFESEKTAEKNTEKPTTQSAGLTASAVTGGVTKAPVIDGVKGSGSEQKAMNLSGGGSGGGKSITMNLTMHNHFNGLRNIDEAANAIVRKINDRLNDSLTAI